MKRTLLKSLVLASILSTAGAAAGPAQAPTSVAVDFAGQKFVLPIPAGYCAIPKASVAGKPYYDLQEQSQAGMNKVGLLFANCEEWKHRERDYSYRIQKLGNYLIPLTNGEEALAPSTYNRNTLIKEIAEANSLANETAGRAQLERNVQGRLSASKVEAGKDVKLLGSTVLEVDGNALYLGLKQTIDYPTEKVTLASVSATTMVSQAVVVLNLYAEFSPTAVDRLIAEQKRNAAALVKANP